MRSRIHYADITKLLVRALDGGALRESQMRFTWHIEGRCENPFIREVYGAPELRLTLWDRVQAALKEHPYASYIKLDPAKPVRGMIHVGHGTSHPFLLEIWTPCRRCERCRRARAALWRSRAETECKSASRTWFGTLTLRPEEQHRLLLKARQTMHGKGFDLEALDVGDQFRVRCGEVSREITLFLKRVRKQSAAPMRYLCVAEQHKSGDPHFHMLVHEVSDEKPVRHAVLAGQWNLGFTKWKLVDDPRQGAYLCKYLAKSSAARVRASVGYGAETASAIAGHGTAQA